MSKPRSHVVFMHPYSHLLEPSRSERIYDVAALFIGRGTAQLKSSCVAPGWFGGRYVKSLSLDGNDPGLETAWYWRGVHERRR